MIERRFLGEIPPKPHTLYKSSSTLQPVTEFVVTRDGFAGGFTLLYLSQPPTGIASIKAAFPNASQALGVFTQPGSDAPLARRHIQSWKSQVGSGIVQTRTALFQTPSRSARVSVLRGDLNSDYAFGNGDADELFFVFEGEGELWTMYGSLLVKKHDYVLIPRGTLYHFRGFKDAELFLVEGDPHIEIPKDFRNPFGQLKMEAPYTHRDFRSPQKLLDSAQQEAFQKCVVLRNNIFTEHNYQGSPCATLGWDGSVYPVAFSIHDYLPKTGKVHLPPNIHVTFAGTRFVICSFVPRLVDYGDGAIPCPYPHNNAHCEEILYYVSGNFTSRKGVQPRSISYHPIGVSHGPQPGNYFASVGSKKTDELAVMVDLWDPVSVSWRKIKGWWKRSASSSLAGNGHPAFCGPGASPFVWR